MLKNLVFDMGRVLIRWTAENIMETFHVSEEDMILLKNAMFATPEWVLMDWGRWDEPEMEAFVRARVPERLWPAVHDCLYHWFDHMVPVPGMKELLKEYKEKGYKLYLLSNASRRLSLFLDHIPGFEYMDGWVVSGCVNLLKPQPEIYKLLLDKYDLNPEETIFVDDLKVNCTGALMCGMKSFLFSENIEELKEYIASLS